ncbi:hypothetical protein [Candidatus Nitrotoga sp. M5]|uniref:hypothetical protein n=1 Tax=Candidatus Nitrotoga sp. M5 TaxID=2890409 RepID=UPI001EF3598E|nr:hypothetical protein [Candidatus Nitrotoga sp. M5]CAH1385411.1 conserved exported hypothetical protein [Candidatus Nitrotoga sp. M5]
MKRILTTGFVSILLLSGTSFADEVINDDLIIDGLLCVGTSCADGEEFELDTIRIKASDPLIKLEDTSTSADFPSNDWSIGIANTGANGAPQFVIKDVSGGENVLILESGPGSSVVLGAGSSVEPGAVSVGTTGSERRISYVDDGVDATDAATKGQLDDYIAVVNTNFGAQLVQDRAELDGEIDTLQMEMNDLLDRLTALESALGD